LQSADDRLQKRGRGLVHEVCVLDLDEHRDGQQRLEELEHHLMELCLAVLQGQIVDLPRHRHAGVERDGEERKPGH
jgi:hypothetical protein